MIGQMTKEGHLSQTGAGCPSGDRSIRAGVREPLEEGLRTGVNGFGYFRRNESDKRKHTWNEFRDAIKQSTVLRFKVIPN
jgi:hypothetical protein